jgi:hypothetical protein
MRIRADGKVLINASSPASTEILGAANTGANYTALFTGDSTAQYTQGIWNKATSGDNLFTVFATEGTISARGSITYNRGGGVVAYNTTSD